MCAVCRCVCPGKCRVAAGAHDDKPGQILVLAAEPVRHPRAHAGPDQPGLPTIHQHERRFVIGHVGMHRTDHRNVIDAFRCVRENLTDFRAALAVPLEFVRTRKRRAGLSFRTQVVHREKFPGILLQRWLGIERINVRRPTIEKNMNDPLGLGSELRLLHRERR